MATLVLSAVGSVITGPIGAMIGALAGQVIDRELLFKPKGYEGPRLTELALQTSSYGTAIPRLFGAIRVAGTVIWATDLIEHRHRDGGKGRPTVTSYSYSASFAVALSARPILAVGRIWADGKLLRGAAGDWKAATGFRLHPGGEDQAVDPLIASAEGVALTPAHRGIAYAVFEDMALEEYGNRIPSLTFEVIADPGSVAAGAIVETLSGGAIGAGEALLPIHGYSAYGETVRGAVAPLIEASGSWPVVAGGGMTLAAGSGSAITLTDPGAGGRGVRRSIEAPDRAPRRVALSHYDPARDYQAGVQMASRAEGQARERRIELPAALPAATAKEIAVAELARAEVERTRRVVTTGWGGMAIAPGSRVAIAGEAGQWRVIEGQIDAAEFSLTLVPVAPAGVPLSASGGRVAASLDVIAGATLLQAFELPGLDDALLHAPRLLIAAAGEQPGWRRAALAVSNDAGGRWDAIGASAAPAVIGAVVAPPMSATALIEDRVSRLIVALPHDAMVLEDASVAALDGGANLALVGEELLQFARAEPIGGGQWALSGLWRGRRGTEDAIGGAVAGDRFMLIDPMAMTVLDGRGGVGATLQVMASGLGDAEPVVRAVAVTGQSVTPPAPVALHVVAGADGARLLRWTRRSRSGWRWIDGTDAPLGEGAERYQLTLDGASGARTVMCDAPEWMLDDPAVARIAVRQVGDHGLSRPATLNFETME